MPALQVLRTHLRKVGAFGLAAGVLVLTVPVRTAGEVGPAGLVAPASERPANGVIGLVVSRLRWVLPENPNCPAGLNKTMSEIILDHATPDERKLLQSPAGRMKMRMLASRTPDGRGSLCVNPKLAPDYVPALNVDQGGGRVDGFDLDGHGTTRQAQGNSCPHQNFTGADGRATVDNQIGRVYACIKGWRPGGAAEAGMDAALVDGSFSILIEISGVDNLQNDPDVTVNIYSSQDHTPFSAAAKPLPNGSLTVHPDKRFRSTGHGRIENGTLKAGPFNIALSTPGAGQKLEYNLREARLELALKPGGNAEGMLGGYAPLDAFYRNQVTIGDHIFFGDGASEVMGFSCPAMFKALNQYADGLRDPQSGQCHGISAAYRIAAVPAFIIHDDAPVADGRH